MKKIIISLLVVIGITNGCSDLLEPQQTSITYNEVFWKSQKDAEYAVNGIYGLYRALMISPDNWYSRGDGTTGFFRSGWNGGTPGQLWSPGDFSPNSTTKSWGSLESFAN